MGETGTAQLDFNPYAEEPRPNLYNIVKNIRDNKVRLKTSAKRAVGRLHESTLRC